jgi:hypothetical protein
MADYHVPAPMASAFQQYEACWKESQKTIRVSKKPQECPEKPRKEKADHLTRRRTQVQRQSLAKAVHFLPR